MTKQDIETFKVQLHVLVTAVSEIAVQAKRIANALEGDIAHINYDGHGEVWKPEGYEENSDER